MQSDWFDRLWIAWDGRGTAILGHDAPAGPVQFGFAEGAGDLGRGWIAVVGRRGNAAWQSGVLADAFRPSGDKAWVRALSLPPDVAALSLLECEADQVREFARVALAPAPDAERRGRLLFAFSRGGSSRGTDSGPILFGPSEPMARRDLLRVNERMAKANQELRWAIEVPQKLVHATDSAMFSVAPLRQVFPRQTPAIAIAPEPLDHGLRAHETGGDFPSIMQEVHARPSPHVGLVLTLPHDPQDLHDICSGIAVAHLLQQRSIPETVKSLRPEWAVAPLSREEIQAWTGVSDFRTPAEPQPAHAVNLLAGLEGREGSPDISFERLAGEGREPGHTYIRVTFRAAGRGDMLLLLDAWERDRLVHAGANIPPGTYVAFRVGRESLEPRTADVRDPILEPAWEAGAEYEPAGTSRAGGRDAHVHEAFWTWIRSRTFGGTPGRLFEGMRNPAAGALPLLIRSFEEALSRIDLGRPLAWGEGAFPKFAQFRVDPPVVGFLLEHPDLVDALRGSRSQAAGADEVAVSSRLSDHLAYRIACAAGVPIRFEQKLDGAAQIRAFLSLVERHGEVVRLLTAAQVRFTPDAVTLEQLRNDTLPALILATKGENGANFIETLDHIGAAQEARELEKYIEDHDRGESIELSSAVTLAEIIERAQKILAEEEMPDPEPVVSEPTPERRMLPELKVEFSRLLEEASKIPDPRLAKWLRGLRSRASGKPTPIFYRTRIPQLHAAITRPATVKVVGLILDGLERWAGVAGLTASGSGSESDQASYDARRQAILKLVAQANISVDETASRGELYAKRKEIVRSISDHMKKKPETSNSIDRDLERDLEEYADVLVHHKAYHIMREAMRRHNGDRDTSRLMRRLALWPRGAEATWSQYRHYFADNGNPPDNFAGPRFD